MTGKIIGLCAVSLTVVGIWAAMAYSAARWGGITIDITGIFSTALYNLLYTRLCPARLDNGRIRLNLQHLEGRTKPDDAGNNCLYYSDGVIYVITQNPDGLYARALSFFPPVTSMVMVLRLSAGSSAGFLEIFSTIVVLIVSVILAIWLAAKVFRTGILMYGKKPSLREVARWLRQR